MTVWSPERVNSRVTIQDGVYLELRKALMSGRFEPGQTLTMASLAKMFGTSLMPVREALRRLVAENALEIVSSGSAVVPNVSMQRLDDISGARALLERAATEAAALQLDAAEIDQLARIAAEHRTIGVTEGAYAMLDKNREFHFRLYGASGSAVLVQLIETLWLSMGPYMRLLSREIETKLEGGKAVYAGTHDEILEALRRRDARAAGDGVVNDIRSTQRLLRGICA